MITPAMKACEPEWNPNLYERYDTEKNTDKLKTLAWIYFIGYWNNRRICSATGRTPPMIKRHQYYDSLKKAAQHTKSLGKMCQPILIYHTISFPSAMEIFGKTTEICRMPCTSAVSRYPFLIVTDSFCKAFQSIFQSAPGTCNIHSDKGSSVFPILSSFWQIQSCMLPQISCQFRCTPLHVPAVQPHQIGL